MDDIERSPEDMAMDARAALARIEQNVLAAMTEIPELLQLLPVKGDQRLAENLAHCLSTSCDWIHGLKYAIEYDTPGSDIVPDFAPEA